MRRHTGWFWNVVLPIALALAGILGTLTVMADVMTSPTEALSTWWGWTGLAVGVAAAVVSKGYFHWLAAEDRSNG